MINDEEKEINSCLSVTEELPIQGSFKIILEMRFSLLLAVRLDFTFFKKNDVYDFVLKKMGNRFLVINQLRSQTSLKETVIRACAVVLERIGMHVFHTC